MFSSFSAKKDLPLSGCNIWLAPDLHHCKHEFKSLIESNGGKYCSRLSGKVNFAVANKVTNEVAEKTSKYTLTIVLDSFIRECVKTATPLFNYTNPKHNELQKENYPNYLSSTLSPISSPTMPATSSPATGTLMQSGSSAQTLPTPSYSNFNVYEYEPNPPRSRGIRERLKSLSLKTKQKAKKHYSSSAPPTAPASPSSQHHKTIAKTPPPSTQRSKLRNASRAMCDSLQAGEEDTNNNITNDNNMSNMNNNNNTNNISNIINNNITTTKMEEGLPLQNLVFVIYGTFSIPREVMENLITSNGGRFVPLVTDEVTHVLFGGEDMEISEFEKANKRQVHIVNEYFLRLMVKY